MIRYRIASLIREACVRSAKTLDTGDRKQGPMTISTRIYAEHPGLALAHTIRSLPDVTVGVRSDAGTDPVHDGHIFWIEAEEFEVVDETLAADPTVAAFSTVDHADDRRTYRITYSDEAKLLTPAILDMGGLTQEARSHANGWILQLQLQDHDTLVGLDHFAEAHGIHLEILDLNQDPTITNRLNYGLTDRQTEALLAAFEHGYYDEPREISLEELASILDVSNTAVSGRLRRGSARLVEEALIDDEDD